MTSPQDWITPFEKNANTTATYAETIDYYERLAAQYDQLQISSHGDTDSGRPIHQLVLSKDQIFEPAAIRASGKRILMINNAIHPGEPCGVDASMLLLRDYLQKPTLQAELDSLVIVLIPMYNIGGALNRNSHTRANQDGPESYGFRGNARHLDLNRDFIKCDSRNAQTFNQIFSRWQPDVLVDNHTSNGADYPYTMTLIATQHNKLGGPLADYLNNSLLPRLYRDMEAADWEMIPYVYARSSPDEGIAEFLDYPRYSSGYASLFNTLSFMPETHMLKPFKDRVMSTYAFMQCMIRAMQEEGAELAKARQATIALTETKPTFELDWAMDMEAVEELRFKGYAAKYKPSEVSGLDRLYYDHNEPYDKSIPYYRNYKAKLSIEKPQAYIIPQAYGEVIERLQWNGVELKRLAEDGELEVELYRILDYKTTKSPYEGHYLHSNVKVEKSTRRWPYFKGDYVVLTNQPTNRYIIETLEPQAPDSWFAWNFFDGILMQKEYFSAYVFEDLAAEYLKADPKLRAELEAAKEADTELAKSARAQLEFVYKRSPHYERTHEVYPVGRVQNVEGLPLM
ncbi:MAG: M14 family zinc carboxypeptidase [Bacteroidota bacterium]